TKARWWLLPSNLSRSCCERLDGRSHHRAFVRLLIGRGDQQRIPDQASATNLFLSRSLGLLQANFSRGALNSLALIQCNDRVLVFAINLLGRVTCVHRTVDNGHPLAKQSWVWVQQRAQRIVGKNRLGRGRHLPRC